MANSPNRRKDRTSGPERGSSFRHVLDAAYRSEESRQQLIHASNWRTPIIVDGLLGTVVFIAGFVLAILWSPVPGGAIGAAGAVYGLLALRRWRHWSALRAEQDTD